MIGHCPSCKKSIAVPDGAAGKKARCSGCQAVFVIEAPTSQTDEVLEVTEVLDDEEPIQGVKLDVLDEVSEAPASKSTKTAARKKKEGSRPAYDDRDDELVPDPNAAADQGSLDFSREMPKLNAGVQMRITAAANWMRIAGFVSFIMALLILVRMLFARQGPGSMAGFMVASGLLYVLAIIIIPCARSLSMLRSRAVGTTAAVLCLVVSLPGLCAMFAVIVGLVVHLAYGGALTEELALSACVMGPLGFAQAGACIWGGVSTLILLGRPDVADAIRDANEIEARTAFKSATFVPSACSRAVLWQISAVVLLLLMLTTYAGFFIYLLIWPPPQETLALKIMLGIAGMFYTIMLLMNIGAIVSLFTKRYFVLTTLGSVSCLVAAFVSYLSGLSSIPIAIAALTFRNSPALAMFGTTSVFMLLLNIVGVVGYMTGMDAARLLRKYGTGAEMPPED